MVENSISAVPAPAAARLTSTRSTSKLALLLSFAAGAAFSWFITEVMLEDEERVARTSLAAPGR